MGRNISNMAETSHSSADDDVLENIEEETNVRYDPDSGSVEFVGTKNDTEHYVDFITYLVSEGYITSDDLPLTASRAQTRYLMNTKARHQDQEMIRPVQISENVWLETNYDSSSKKRYIKKFVEQFVW